MIRMKQCPQCGRENSPTSQYCESCGSILESQASDTNWSDYTEASIRDIPPPPPPPVESYYPADAPPYNYQNQLPETRRPSRIIGSLLVSILLYLYGAFFTFAGSLGLLTILKLHGILRTNNYAAFGISLAVVSLAVLILILINYKSPRLRWWQRLLWALGATLCDFVILLALILSQFSSAQQVPSNPAYDLTLGGGLFIYGLVVNFIALW